MQSVLAQNDYFGWLKPWFHTCQLCLPAMSMVLKIQYWVAPFYGSLSRHAFQCVKQNRIRADSGSQF